MGGDALNPRFLKEDQLQEQPRMIIMMGLSRTGKSTTVNKTVREAASKGLAFAIVSGDDIRRALGVRYEARLEDQVKYTMGIIASALMMRKQNIIVDETNLTEEDRQRWITLAIMAGYIWTIAEIEPLPEDIHRQECAKHNFAWSIIEGQKKKYQPVPEEIRKTRLRYTLVRKEQKHE